MQYFYLLALVFSLSCLAYADRKYGLVLFPRAPKVFLTLLTGMAFFLAWDIAGILLDVFSTNQEWVSGLHLITPDLPVEEFLFLALLCYVTLICWSAVCSRTS